MKIIGLMSGTSADGIDAALCEINGTPPRLEASILKGITIPYGEIRHRIIAACQKESSHVDEVARLNFELGHLFADAVKALGVDAGCISMYWQNKLK